MKQISWKDILGKEKEKEYFKNIISFIESERKKGKIIYPSNKDIFNAFSYTPFSDIKVVIIGQDPYHGEGQAHGLSFSVKDGVPFPPSLQNIFKELYDDVGISTPKSGSLVKWAKEGVLLLNAVLSVEASKPASHQNIGWETFTDFVISKINEEKEGVVFILWGGFAKKKCAKIDETKHFILEAPHPSPLSCYRGFFGSKPFSKTNEILRKLGKKEIDWSLG
ncbi:MAG: uracil-DNA glycosylase [Bdellovibrionota bacterium]